MACPDQVDTWVRTNDFFAGYRVIQGQDVFVPTNNQYPHIHIGKGFITYSKTASNHMYLAQGDQVFQSRIQNAYDDSHEAHIMQICRYMQSQC